MATMTSEDRAIAQIPASCTCEYERQPGGDWRRTIPRPSCAWHAWERPAVPAAPAIPGQA